MTVKKVVFDVAKVMDRVDEGTRRALFQAGGFVRQTARRSIRNATGKRAVSQPGEPPVGHTGHLRGTDGAYGGIAFEVNPYLKSVVIGPVKLNQVFYQGDGKPAAGTVPQVLEFGGRIGIREVLKYGRWQRNDLRKKTKEANLPSRIRWVQISARPYMGPALAKTRPRFPELWRNSVTSRAA